MYLRHVIVTMAAFCLMDCTSQEGAFCGGERANGLSLTLSVNSTRNGTGDWVDTFAARTEFSNSSEGMRVDVRHDVFECDGKRVVYIQGVTKDESGYFPELVVPTEVPQYEMTFHENHGSNVEIVDHGRAAQKIDANVQLDSTAFTNRPLKDNEMFEVRLDKKGSKFSQNIGIGVIRRSPKNFRIPKEIHFSPHVWVYHHASIYSDKTYYKYGYGKNLHSLQVGETVGVMRKDTGAIHFFVNGEDQGPAVPNLPPPVYGVVELWNDAIKATIVRP